MRGPSIAIPPSRALAQFALGALLAALAQCAFAAAPSADPPSGEADWQSLMDGASRAFGDGRLEEAENSVRRALAMAEEFPALDPRRIRSLDGLAQVLFRQGQQAEQEAQDLIASQSGEAAAIRDMEQRAESKFGEAETLLERAIRDGKRNPPAVRVLASWYLLKLRNQAQTVAAELAEKLP
ncbi:MAG: hypothetical protein BWZ10_00614 [candidate division BRC1 bacterium ADurb.BinA364]|nr:MAG: hypothetical protein BWZ10_00614 [candidate division BRC1 bacterium ADurb.BinA364]